MTNYCMNLIMDRWIKPNIDTSAWKFFDLSCKARDDTQDQVSLLSSKKNDTPLSR
jgi:isocitrate dehydrogenase